MFFEELDGEYITQALTYIHSLSHCGSYRTRLRRYHAAKDVLLPYVPRERRDDVVRELCRRLRV